MEHFIIDFFLGYMLRRWLGEEITKYLIRPITNRIKKYILKPALAHFKSKLIRTEREAAIFLHYKNKALDDGHTHKSPVECRDGRCRII